MKYIYYLFVFFSTSIFASELTVIKLTKPDQIFESGHFKVTTKLVDKVLFIIYGEDDQKIEGSIDLNRMEQDWLRKKVFKRFSLQSELDAINTQLKYDLLAEHSKNLLNVSECLIPKLESKRDGETIVTYHPTWIGVRIIPQLTCNGAYVPSHLASFAPNLPDGLQLYIQYRRHVGKTIKAGIEYSDFQTVNVTLKL